jgi:CRP-like cAMP-binding protein
MVDDHGGKPPRGSRAACRSFGKTGNVSFVQAIEAALGATSLFAHLRLDEVGKIARMFESMVLDEGVIVAFPAEREKARLVVVISGGVDAIVDDPAGEVHVRLGPGDRYGEAMLISNNFHGVRLRPRVKSEIAIIDRTGLERILNDYPAVALPLAAELATELRTRNDQVRQIAELQLSVHDAKQIDNAVKRLRSVMALRSAAVRRPTTRGLFRRFVVDQGAEPPF